MGKTGVVLLARVDDHVSFGNSGIKPVFSGFWGGPTFGVGLGGGWVVEEGDEPDDGGEDQGIVVDAADGPVVVGGPGEEEGKEGEGEDDEDGAEGDEQGVHPAKIHNRQTGQAGTSIC